MDRGTWQAIVHRVAKSRTQLKGLSMHACKFSIYIYSTGKKSESESHSVMSDSLEPHGLNSPCNSPGQNTESVAIPFSRGSSQPRGRTQVSPIVGRFFTS